LHGKMIFLFNPKNMYPLTWALLKHLSSLSSSSWVCMGDFNEVFDNSERRGRGLRPEWQMRDFREAVVHCELHDLGFAGPPFTWRNKRVEEAFVLARLDRVLASAAWISDFEGAYVHHLPVQNSDHCPVLLSIPYTGSIKKGKKMFKFEAMWTKEEECRGVIEATWGQAIAAVSPMYKVTEKLKGRRASLVAWSRVQFGSFASSIKDKREHLQHLMDEFPLWDSPAIMEVQDELNGLLEKEKIFWRQRSKVSWMSEGDKNTKFFHAQCNHRRQLNSIKGLRDNHGVWQTDKSKILKIAVDYFKTIFTSWNPSLDSIQSCLEGVEGIVMVELNG
jgi:hypothetical protein